MKGISGLLAAVFVLMLLQSAGGLLQIRDYRQAVKRLHRLGNVGVGQKRGRFLNGHVVIIACDAEGIIKGAEVLDGIGVWARFHTARSFLNVPLPGSSIYDLLALTEGFSKKDFEKYRGYVRALEALEARLEGRELTREQEKYLRRKGRL